MEQVEEISQKLDQLKKKLAWSWVYDVDKQIKVQVAKIEKLKERIPTCQLKIDRQLVRLVSQDLPIAKHYSELNLFLILSKLFDISLSP